ncbi:hypothetical protein BFP72_07640 [Reichenbachiella sp. 5M10]|uniref:M35 family metallo-endopeptidase n=1 Tax=Reichenbachiella sp. 5M10 TaxID=1889772 RepID=UPI000C1538DA|nr:M35 family metallo-endopeptidase [Reichenbachiella sp. 5M10]PIB35279.1 hypothetical protein BFP72_07640 [Reichenbachiella sp. 5M10]
MRPLSNNEWDVTRQARDNAVSIVRTASNALRNNEEVIVGLIGTYMNVRMVDSRRESYANMFTRIGDTIQNLQRDNFRFDTHGVDEQGRPYYAEVDPNDANHRVVLTTTFMNASPIGVDSQAGTLIHEATHWNDVRGTDDHGYGDDIHVLSSLLNRNNAETWERILELYGDHLNS